MTRLTSKKNISLYFVVLTLFGVTMLSGCVSPWAITTIGWDHTNEQGTAVRLWGHLVLGQSSANWNEGFVWDTQHHNDWQNYQYLSWADNHEGFGLFSLDLTDLDRTTTYHYRAIGEYTKSRNVIRVGADLTFIPGGPRVTTKNASNIGLTEVTIVGNLGHMGGAASCDVYFLYGTDSNSLNIQTTPITMTNTGEFSTTLTDLTSNTTYFFKAVAENDADTWSGIILSATPGKPVVVTRLPGQIGMNHAVLKAELWHMGGTTTCDVWFIYSSTSPNQLDQISDTLTLDNTGSFEIPLTDLSPQTKYWYQAVADNGVAQAVGDIYEFTTTPTVNAVPDETNAKAYHQEKTNNQQNIESKIPAQYRYLLDNHPQIRKALENW
jgi:hypothetical protein